MNNFDLCFRKISFSVKKYFSLILRKCQKVFFAKCSNAPNKLLLQRYFSENCFELQNETKNNLNFDPFNYGKRQSPQKVCLPS